MAPNRSRREEILEQATRRAGRDGLAGVSIGQLAGDLKMSKSGLFSHFGSKEEMKIAVLEHAAGRFTQNAIRPALREPRGEPRLQALFDNWMGWLEDNPFGTGCVFIAAASELDDQQGPTRTRLANLQRDFLDLIANIVRTGIAEGHFEAATDPEQVAHEVNGIFLTYHHAARLLDDPAASDRARSTFASLLRGIRSQP